MPKRLYASVNASTEQVVLERSAPDAPWQVAVKGGAGADEGAPSVVENDGAGRYTVVHRGRRMHVQVLKHDAVANILRVRINGRTYQVAVQDESVQLLRMLGLEKASRKVSEVKAPMPGLVLNVLVKPGDAVKKDEPLLVLEAMKMENVIRAPGDAVVNTVPAEQGKAVEKGQLLVGFV
jgi:biotin carboxyl carrier protein